jgi:hypothetical protein
MGESHRFFVVALIGSCLSSRKLSHHLHTFFSLCMGEEGWSKKYNDSKKSWASSNIFSLWVGVIFIRQKEGETELASVGNLLPFLLYAAKVFHPT